MSLHGLGLGPLDGPALRILPWFVGGATAAAYPMATFHYCWGDARRLEAVWETVLADRGHGSGAAAFDVEDPMVPHVRRHVRRGVFGRLGGVSRWHITGRPAVHGATGPFLWPVENR